MGQALYAPPSVAGWDGGPAWINSTTMLARTNLALALLGKDGGLGGRCDARRRATRVYVDLLVQDAFDARRPCAGAGEVTTLGRRARVPRRPARPGRLRPGARRAAPSKRRAAAARPPRLVLTSPEYQLA